MKASQPNYDKLMMEITLFTNAIVEIAELPGVSNKDKAMSIHIAEKLFHTIISKRIARKIGRVSVASTN